MGKPLINTKQWTSNDMRMLIIAHFVLVYPILAGSLFMVMFFFVIPKLSIWVKAYWLIASGAWILLLAVVLPLMGGPNEYNPTGTQRRPKKKAKEHGSSTEKIPMSQDIRVEATKMDHINRDSVLTTRSSQKSENSSSDGGVEKGTLEENADKENCENLQGSLNKSRENIQKSMDSICTNDTLNDKKALTQSGEFLNDCIGKWGDDSDKQDDGDIHEQHDSGVHKEENKNQDEFIDDKKYATADTLENDNTQYVAAVVHLQTHSPEKENADDSITDNEKDSAKKESKDDDSDIEMINESNDLNGNLEEDWNEKGKPELKNDKNNDIGDTLNIDGKTENIDSQINKTFVVTPTPIDVIDKQLCKEAVIVDEEEEEEIGELVELPSANSLSRRGSNVVHLFIQGN